MNISNEIFKAACENQLNIVESVLERTFGSFESLVVNDTYQFDDYSKYVSSAFDEKKKRNVREEQFPKDCESAFDMGVRFARQANK